MRTSETVTQRDLRDAEPVHHRDGDLKSALAAGGERGACKLQRVLGTERLVGDERVLGAGRRGQEQ